MAVAQVRWYRRAIDAGNTPAPNSLGVLCMNGGGVPLNREGFDLIIGAAMLGRPRAMQNATLGFENGLGIPRSAVKANFFRRLAENAR